MTTEGTPGNEPAVPTGAFFPEGGYPDYRSPEQLRADMDNVRRQMEVLTPPQSHDRIHEIIRAIQRRQEEAAQEYALRFDTYSPSGGEQVSTDVLVARGQLVVRVAPAPQRAEPGAADTDRDVYGELRDMGYTPAPERPSIGPSRDTRTVAFESGWAPQRMVEDMRTLRDKGIEAAMNVVVPLGHIIKGDDYPGPTTGPGAYPTAVPPPPAAFAFGQPKVRVAVIDTGITPEIRGDRWLDRIPRGPHNWDYLDVLPDDGPPAGDGRLDWFSGHGTFATGIVQQVAPYCEIWVYRFTTSDGLGTEKDVAEMLIRAAEEGDRDGVHLIINASVGVPAAGDTPPLAMRDAVEYIAARYPGVLIVASAGNSGDEQRMYPAAFDGVVGVGALTSDYRPAPFSTRGDWVTCSTVGVGVVSTFVAGTEPPEPHPQFPDYTFPPSAWGVWSGTSFSAPQITGAVARVCQEQGLAPRDALDAMLKGQPRLPGFGYVVQNLLPGTPTP